MATVENLLCSAEPLWNLHLAKPRGRATGKTMVKKIRSRSSPVRSRAALPENLRRRQRSPSASPWSDITSTCTDLEDSCCHNFQNNEEHNKPAYFSIWPPPEPLRVVVITGDLPFRSSSLLTPTLYPPAPYTDASPSPPPRIIHRSRVRKRWIGGRRASLRLVHGLLADLTDSLPLAPPVFVPSPTDYVTLDQTSYVDDVIRNNKGSTKTLSPKKAGRRHRDRSQSKTCTTKLIFDDDSALPNDIKKVPDDIQKVAEVMKNFEDDIMKVPDDVQKVPDDGQKIPDDVQKVPDVTNIPVTSGAVVPFSSEVSGVCRNVAVQARTSSRGPRKSTPNAAREPQTETSAAPAEVWIGDVRALRDSHVRLVRRQLRHIAQLNRTLDHAGRYPQTTEVGGPMQQTPSVRPTSIKQLAPLARAAQPTPSVLTRPTLCSQSSQPIPSSPTQREKSRRSPHPNQRPHSRSHRTREE